MTALRILEECSDSVMIVEAAAHVLARLSPQVYVLGPTCLAGPDRGALAPLVACVRRWPASVPVAAAATSIV